MFVNNNTKTIKVALIRPKHNPRILFKPPKILVSSIFLNKRINKAIAIFKTIISNFS